MKGYLATLLAVLLVLLTVVPAYAVPPDTFAEAFAVEEKAADCGDFVIMSHVVVERRWTTFFDQSGVPVRLQIHGHGVDNLYNPANPTLVVSGKFNWNFEGDPNTFDGTMTGTFYHITLPGYGSVYFDVGKAAWMADRDVPYVPLAGHHEFDPILCEVLRVQNP